LHILVTGGAGFIGSQLATWLRCYQGHAVTVLDNLVRRGSEENLPQLKAHDIKFIHGDVRRREDFHGLRNIELVCDCAAQASVVTGYANPTFDLQNNAFGAIEVLEFAREREIPVIFWSTNRVYPAHRINNLPIEELPTRLSFKDRRLLEPIRGFDAKFGISEKFTVDGGTHSIYGLSKLMADLACQEYAQAYGIPVIINRFGVVSGSGQFGHADQGFLVWWVIAHLLGQPLVIHGHDGKQVRDVLFIEDLLALIDKQVPRIHEFAGQVFNVGGGAANAISLLELTAKVQERTKVKMNLGYLQEPRPNDLKLYWTDHRRVSAAFAWQPRVTIDEGLDRIVEWAQENLETLRRRCL